MNKVCSIFSKGRPGNADSRIQVVVVFKGNPQIEANLPLDVVSWSVIPGMNGTCDNCTANAAAVQAYLEIKEETNDFEATLARYAGAVSRVAAVK